MVPLGAETSTACGRNDRIVGPGGIFSLGDPHALTALVANAGFTDPTVETINVTFRARGIEHHIDRVGSLAGPLASILQAASTEQRAAVRHTASGLAAQYMTDDGLQLPERALLVHARRDGGEGSSQAAVV